MSNERPQADQIAGEPSRQQVDELIGLFDQRQLKKVLERGDQLLTEFPSAIFLHRILSAASLETGRFDKASEHLSFLVKLDPQDFESHCSLGDANKGMGNFVQAVSCYRSAIKIKPDFARAHHDLGITLRMLGRHQEAIESFSKAIEINPKLALAYNGLGSTLMALGRNEEATVLFEKAVALRPKFAIAYNNLGRSQISQNLHENALASFSKAVEIRPDYAMAHNNRGIVLEYFGRREEAIASFNKALEINPKLAMAHYNLSNHRIYNAEDPLLGQMEALLKEEGGDPADGVTLQFAVAKAYGDLGRVGDSFDMLEKANNSALKQGSIDPSAEYKASKKLYDWFAENAVQYKGREHSSSDFPVSLFILGPSRSGKTTVESLISAQNNVMQGYEDPAFHSSVEAALKVKQMRYPGSLSQLPSDVYPAIRNAYRGKISRYLGSGKVITNTLPATIWDAPGIFDCLPNVRFVFVKRNLEDLLFKMYSRRYLSGNSYSYDLKETKRYIELYYDMSDALMNAFPDISCCLEYENVVNDPASALDEMCRLCDIKPNHKFLPVSIANDIGCSKPFADRINAKLST